ncbi:MAG: hypothetical protein ACTSVX_02445 [Promethearchaeota archaeon]
MNCEKLIVTRFLEILNEETGNYFNFKNCVKEDELPNYSKQKTCDYHCKDIKSEKEIGIEIKRLIPPDIKKIKNLHQITKYTENQIGNSLCGNFILIINTYDFKYKRAKTLKKVFDDIKDEILSIGHNIKNGELKNLSSYKGIGLLKVSETKKDFNLQFWPISFRNASNKEIIKALKDSLSKFGSSRTENQCNIILLVELSNVARRIEINDFIKDLETGIDEHEIKFNKKYNFKIIDGIYQICIGKKPIIAQIYPKLREFSFFPSKREGDNLNLYKHCLDYFFG